MRHGWRLLILATLSLVGAHAPAFAQQSTTVRVGHFPNITHVQALVARGFERQGRSWFGERLGPGVKQHHVSYLGDADLGAGTNVGAGTITANFDGQKKHRTTVGKRVFLGVDTMLRAPITLGDDSRTGAGAVVTKDVPDYALVVGNPGRVAGWMCQCGVKLASSSRPPLTAACASCGTTYLVPADGRFTRG